MTSSDSRLAGRDRVMLRQIRDGMTVKMTTKLQSTPMTATSPNSRKICRSLQRKEAKPAAVVTAHQKAPAPTSCAASISAWAGTRASLRRKAVMKCIVAAVPITTRRGGMAAMMAVSGIALTATRPYVDTATAATAITGSSTRRRSRNTNQSTPSMTAIISADRFMESRSRSSLESTVHAGSPATKISPPSSTSYGARRCMIPCTSSRTELLSRD